MKKFANPKARTEILDSVALLALDLQDCFIDPLPDKASFLKRCSFAIQTAEAFGLRVIFTEQVPEKLGPVNAKLLALAKRPHRFGKRSFSALQAPGLIDYLRQNEIYHLLVCGLETPICVYQTGLQAHDEDLEITLLSDAISGRRPEDAGPVLESLRSLGCNALPSETVFYSLLGDVDSPFFRELTRLVKHYGQEATDIQPLDLTPPTPPTGPPDRESEPAQSQSFAQAEPQDQSHGPSRRSRSRRGRRGRSRRDASAQNAGEQGQASEPSQNRPPPKAEPKPERPDAQPSADQEPRRAESQPAAETPEAPRPKTRPRQGDKADAPIEPGAKKSASKKTARKRAPAKKAAKKTAAKKAARKPAEAKK